MALTGCLSTQGGIVTLTWRGRRASVGRYAVATMRSGRRFLVPNNEGVGSDFAIGAGCELMSVGTEMAEMKD
jgi:hypothetical protein